MCFFRYSYNLTLSPHTKGFTLAQQIARSLRHFANLLQLIQLRDFLLCQDSDRTSLQIAQSQKSLLPPLQLEHMHAPGCHHPTHLMVFALTDGDQAFAFA